MTDSLELSASTRVNRASRIAARVLGSKTVVVVIDEGALHTLNEVGTFIWQQLGAGERTVAELVDALVEAFEVEGADASRDLDSFLRHMADLGAVEIREAA